MLGLSVEIPLGRRVVSFEKKAKAIASKRSAGTPYHKGKHLPCLTSPPRSRWMGFTAHLIKKSRNCGIFLFI
jgi:hypothetical protein